MVRRFVLGIYFPDEPFFIIKFDTICTQAYYQLEEKLMATKKPKLSNRHKGSPIMAYTPRKEEFEEKARSLGHTMSSALRILINNFLDEE